MKDLGDFSIIDAPKLNKLGDFDTTRLNDRAELNDSGLETTYDYRVIKKVDMNYPNK